jgi:hypothetical protein
LYSLSNPSVIFLEVVRVGIGRCDVSEEAYGLYGFIYVVDAHFISDKIGKKKNTGPKCL